MKDAKGHGSDPRGGSSHMDGVNKIGKSPLNYGQLQGLWYHGSPVGEAGPGTIHVGTERAAKIALEARIGIPADGYGWHGQEYGKTLLAGQDTLKKMGQITNMFGATGFNAHAPQKDYFPPGRTERATMGGGKGPGISVPFDAHPAVFMYQLEGKMNNRADHPLSDSKANAVQRQLRNAGVYYKNEAEDSGSISAVVPNKTFLKRVI